MCQISLGENFEIQAVYPSSAQRLCESNRDQRSHAPTIAVKPIETPKMRSDWRRNSIPIAQPILLRVKPGNTISGERAS